MQTVTIQIGNSDSRLAQSDWAAYVKCVNTLINSDDVNEDIDVFFFATSSNERPWQNACWVIGTNKIDYIKRELTKIREQFDQFSVAVTIGETEFI